MPVDNITKNTDDSSKLGISSLSIKPVAQPHLEQQLLLDRPPTTHPPRTLHKGLLSLGNPEKAEIHSKVLQSRLPYTDPIWASGLEWKKWPKMDFGPPQPKNGKNGQRETWPKNGSKTAISPFFGHSSSFSQWGQIHFWPFFRFRARGPKCTVQSGS